MMDLARFMFAIAPELHALGKDLHRWYQGDPARAKAAMRRVPSWGTLLDASEQAIDERLARLHERGGAAVPPRPLKPKGDV